MTDRTCTRCGSPIVAGAHFCSRCGHDVSGEQAVLATAKMAPVDVSQPAAPQSEILEPLRQATAGEYDIAGELGRGGMATVFLAHDIALDRKVAIKVMTPSLVTGAGMVERFKREARTAASLSHPHIIPIYAVREMGTLLFFVMKFVEGRSLDTIIREQGPLPIPLVQAIMAQVGGALGYAHRRGIVHRDIKPANIMLDDEGWAVVTDFGIAKVADARGLTMTGVTIGTPSYMSPEQCASKEITGATDQYSLGIVAFELLTGKIPFDADSLMGIMWKHFNEPPPPIGDHRPDCPPNVADAIARMLAKGPDERWPTMEEAIAAIGQPPMAPGDPVRKQMRALAAGGDGAALRDQVHTPASPIPTGGVSPDAPTMPSGAAPIPSGMQPPATPPPTPPPAQHTPPPTPPPTQPPSVTDAPTVATGGYAADDAEATVVSPLAPAPPATTRPVATSGATAPPVQPAPAPARRVPVMALGLVGLALVSALGVWGVMALGGGGTDAADSTAAVTEVAAPGAPPPAPVARLQLNPESQSMAVGASGELLAFLMDSANTPLGNRAITWTSSDPAVATVRAGQGVSGVVEARQAGTARIIAMSEGHADTATVTVTATRAAVASVAVRLQTTELAPGDTVGVVTLVRDAGGGNLGGRGVELRSSDQAVLRVAGTRLIALAPGNASVVAVSEGVQSSPTRVTVRVPPVQSVAVQGPRTGLEAGRSARFGLTVLDARNRVVSDFQATWRSSNPSVATVAADGTVRAVGEGDATITATVAGRTGEFALRVRPPPRVEVARIAIGRQVATLEAGRTHSVSASPQDAQGRTLLDRSVTWESSNPAVATVGPDGTITARAPGRVTISAASDGQVQRFELEVTPPPTTVAEAVPVTPPGDAPASPAVTAAALALGAEFTCAALSDGAAQCWGESRPAAAVPPSRFQAVAAGIAHACGLSGDGTVSCWGNNRYGQLGNGESANQTVTRPVRVATDLRFRAIVAGGSHSCGIATDGTAWCWGRGNDGQLGNNSGRDQNAPVAVTRGLTFTELAAGDKHTCGIASDGKAYCWGDGFSYQLGLGSQVQRREPDDVDVREPLRLIAAGRESTCGVGVEGTVYCWGRGNTPFGGSPRRVETDLRFTQLAVGDGFACGLTAQGAAWCWGRNGDGQLGDGSGRDQRAPVRVATSEALQTIAAGNTHACAVARGGATLCWGANGKGQVSATSGEPAATPVTVQIRP